jgi:hypothetical protein
MRQRAATLRLDTRALVSAALLLLAVLPALAWASGVVFCDDARAAYPSPPEARGARGLAGDWDHACEVIEWLRYRTPPRHVAYVLGGSASRESVTSEPEWSHDLSRRLGGKPAAGYVMSSSCQTFIEDARVISALPKGRGTALIMIGLTRFYTVHVNATVSPTAIRKAPPRPWYQHHYDSRDPLPLEEKRQLVQNWRPRHLTGFGDYYAGTLNDLDAAVDACKERGIRPVLVEMPANLVAIGHEFDDVRAIYQEGCRALAEERGIAYLDFNGVLRLRARDFYDLWHLLPDGRARWQARLSRELVAKGLL